MSCLASGEHAPVGEKIGIARAETHAGVHDEGPGRSGRVEQSCGLGDDAGFGGLGGEGRCELAGWGDDVVLPVQRQHGGG